MNIKHSQNQVLSSRKRQIRRIVVQKSSVVQGVCHNVRMKPWGSEVKHLSIRQEPGCVLHGNTEFFSNIVSWLQFFSVALGHFSEQNWDSQNSFSNLQIVVPLMYIQKATSDSYEHVANGWTTAWNPGHSNATQHYYGFISLWLERVSCITKGSNDKIKKTSG